VERDGYPGWLLVVCFHGPPFAFRRHGNPSWWREDTTDETDVKGKSLEPSGEAGRRQRRQGEGETRGQGDGGTKRIGETENRGTGDESRKPRPRT